MTDPTYNVCPVCSARQDAALLCSSCTDALERTLGDVRSLVTDLQVSISKQAKIGSPSGKGGLARERSPINWGAVEAADTLGNVLTTWARDVTVGADWTGHGVAPAVTASFILLFNIDAIRRHPAVAELVDEITDAVEQARRAVDRPADRMYLGQCYAAFPDEDGQDVTCYAEIWAREGAHEVQCRVCSTEHPVAERRAWLLLKAADMLCTVKEASRYIGDIGGITVTEASIRGLIHRQRLAYRVGTTTFRLGDLLEVLTDMKAKAAA